MVITENWVKQGRKPRLTDHTGNRAMVYIMENWNGSAEQKQAEEFRRSKGCTCIEDMRFKFMEQIKAKESAKNGSTS